MHMARKQIYEHSPNVVELQNLVNEELIAHPDAVISDGWDVVYDGEQLIFFADMILKAATGVDVGISTFRIKIFGGQVMSTLKTEYSIWLADQDPRSYFQHGLRIRAFGTYNAICVLYSRGGP